MTRLVWNKGMWEGLTLEDYNTLDASLDPLVALAVASGKYDVLCPEQERLAEMLTELPEHIKDFGFRVVTALDCINEYMQDESIEDAELTKGINLLISVLEEPLQLKDLPRNHRLVDGLCELFGVKGRLSMFLVVIAKNTYRYTYMLDIEEGELLETVSQFDTVYSKRITC